MNETKHTPKLYAHQHWVTDKESFRLDERGTRWGDTPTISIYAGTPQMAICVALACNAYDDLVALAELEQCAADNKPYDETEIIMRRLGWTPESGVHSRQFVSDLSRRALAKARGEV